MIRYLLIFFSMLIAVKTALPQERLLENEINRIDTLVGEELLEEVLLIYDSLTRIVDHQQKVAIANRVFEITKEKDDLAHSISLVTRVRFFISDDYSLLEKAYNIASRYENKELMLYFDEWQVDYFLENGDYEKAMLYLLRLRDKSKEFEADESYRHALNVLGDIYYTAKLMEQAKVSYEELLQYYIDNEEWNYWRPYMLMNNLGEIALFNDDSSTAYYWFSRSMKIADTLLNQPYRYNTIAYTKLKLAELYRLRGEYKSAFTLISEVDQYPDGSVFEDVIQEFYYQKAMLYLDNSQFEKALQMTMKLYPSYPYVFTEYRFLPEVYRLLADIYQGKKQYGNALKYLQKYTHLSDSIEKQGNIARSIILLANKNYEAIEDEIKLEKQRSDLEQQKMRIINEAEQKKQSILLYSLLVGAFLLIIIIVIISRSNLHRKKVNSRLNLQKEKIQEYAKELRVANNTKDKFFSIIAHDLRGPVGTLNNLIQLLSDKYEDIDENERKRILISVGKSSQNSYKLLTNLLDWSRSQLGKVEYNPLEFNIKERIEHVYMLIKGAALQKKQKVVIQVPDHLNIVNDKSMFETVMRNLLSNSVKFTPVGGEIVISANSTDNRVDIHVNDSGIGIPEEMISKLFNISNKSQRKGTNDELGTGLGLLLCNEFVEKMGGTISVTSEEGRGSSFVVSLEL